MPQIWKLPALSLRDCQLFCSVFLTFCYHTAQLEMPNWFVAAAEFNQKGETVLTPLFLVWFAHWTLWYPISNYIINMIWTNTMGSTFCKIIPWLTVWNAALSYDKTNMDTPHYLKLWENHEWLSADLFMWCDKLWALISNYFIQ